MTAFPHVTVHRLDTWIEVRPQAWDDPTSPASHHGMAVLGGTVLHRADAAASDLPRALILDVEPALLWLGALYGPAVVDAVLATDQDGETRTVTAAPQDPDAADRLRLLTRALWYGRWWPSGDPADPEERPVLDEGLLAIDTGTLAWEAGMFLEDDELADILLGRSRVALLSALSRARGLTGRLREHVDGRLANAVDATLDLAAPEDPDALLDVLAQLRDDAAQADAAVTQALATWDESLPVVEEELASTAATSADAEFRAVRYTTVDWALVPPRSVSSAEYNVTYSLTDANGGALVEVEVEAGDHATPSLTAWMHLGESGGLLARLVLVHDGTHYRGSVLSPPITVGSVDALGVHITGADSEPAPGAQPSWLGTQHQEDATSLRRFVRALVVDQRARALGDGTPLLCEVDGW